MSRRTIVIRVVLSLIAACMLVMLIYQLSTLGDSDAKQAPVESATSPDEAAPKKRPNIVVIVANDLGYGDLGCYGQKLMQTPHIDRLAGDGRRFTDFYAGGDTSEASHWCLLTGRWTAFAAKDDRQVFTLGSNQRTLASLMGQAGYETGFVGTWLLAGDKADDVPTAHGFHEWAGTIGMPLADGFFPTSILRNAEQVRIEANAAGKRGEDFQEVLTQEAVSFLERHKNGKPFLLVITYPLPGLEVPLDVSESYANQDWPDAAKAYATRISRLDQDVGTLVERVQQFGLADRTAILLTSDRARTRITADTGDFFHSAADLRVVSGELYDGRLRVPLIAKWPGHVAAKTETNYPAAIWDFLRTFAAMAGGTLPANASDGVSLVASLSGQTTDERGMLYWEVREGGFGQGVRIGDWKVVRPRGKMDSQFVELYDLKHDPQESSNVAREHPEVLAKFLRKG
jgi:arylsulfatase A-like enzyme